MLRYYTDVEVLARLLYGEARCEPHLGKEAVACVVRNRVHQPCWWRTTWRGVMLRPYQFSCFNTEYIEEVILPEMNDSWFDCLEVAIAYMSIDNLADKTDGATHYCRVDVNPTWETAADLTVVIGNHKFFKNVP